MFIAELMLAFLIAAFFVIVGVFAFDRRGPWGSGWSFFALLFLMTWAFGLWLVPFGPTAWGVAFIPFLMAGLFFAVLFAALPPVPGAGYKAETGETTGAFTAAMWILILFLLVAVGTHYVDVVSYVG